MVPAFSRTGMRPGVKSCVRERELKLRDMVAKACVYGSVDLCCVCMMGVCEVAVYGGKSELGE